VLIVMIDAAPSSPSTSPAPVLMANRRVAPMVRPPRPAAASTASATAAPATRLAEMAPGSAYAVEVTSIAGSPPRVMVVRADHNSPAIHNTASVATRMGEDDRTAVASSCAVMRPGYAART
jgi:hypothetical protein